VLQDVHDPTIDHSRSTYKVSQGMSIDDSDWINQRDICFAEYLSTARPITYVAIVGEAMEVLDIPIRNILHELDWPATTGS
jgi:hypothetical protein